MWPRYPFLIMYWSQVCWTSIWTMESRHARAKTRHTLWPERRDKKCLRFRCFFAEQLKCHVHVSCAHTQRKIQKQTNASHHCTRLCRPGQRRLRRNFWTTWSCRGSASRARHPGTTRYRAFLRKCDTKLKPKGIRHEIRAINDYVRHLVN